MSYTQLIVTQCEMSNDKKVKVIMGAQKRSTEYNLGRAEVRDSFPTIVASQVKGANQIGGENGGGEVSRRKD